MARKGASPRIGFARHEPEPEQQTFAALPPKERRAFEAAVDAIRAGGEGGEPQPWVIVKRTEESEDEFAVFAVTLRRGEPWLLRAVMRVGGKRPWSFSRISVEHLTSPDGVEVLADAMRCFSLSEVRSKAIDQVHRKREFLEIRRQAGAEVSAADKRWARRVSEEAKRMPLERGPKGFPVNHYRRVALRYLELVGDGRRDVLKALAAEEGRKRETIRDWIRKATRLGFLAPGKPGAAEARPGPNLYKREET